MPDEVVRRVLADAVSALDALRQDDPVRDAISRAGVLVGRRLAAGGLLVACGNGGSMADASHLAAELTGRFRRDRAPLRAVAVSDPAHLSAVGNDFGFEHVFARYVEGVARQGDVLVAFSTSGASPNVVAAATAARARDVAVVAVTGRTGSPLGALADVEVCTPGDSPDVAQQQHAIVLHAIVAVVEHVLGTPPS